MSEEGELKKRIDAKTYRHNFSNCSGIDVMVCNYAKVGEIKDVVKFEDVEVILDEAKQEFYKVTELPHDEQASKYRLLIKKWFGKVMVI